MTQQLIPNIGKWDQVVLGEQVDLLTGFPFQSARYIDDVTGISLLRGDNIVQGVLRWEDVKRWPADSVEALSDYFLQDGDVVIAMDRPWIEAGLKYACISQHDVPCLLVQRVARLRARGGLDQQFLRYLIGSAAFTNHVLAVQTGTAVPHISPSQIRDFHFQRPPLDEQREIARILGALDDKIEANRRMNATLEATAQALFRSWFVDFDPVRAKAAGRAPEGMDAATAALFPDGFEASALGDTPRGWHIGRLDELLILQRGFDLPASERTAGKYAVLAASGPSGTHSEYKVRGPGVTTGRSGVLGRVFFVHDDYWPLNTSLYIKEFIGSRPVHAYHLLLSLDFALFNAGSAVPTLNRNHVHNLPVIVPPLTVVEAYEAQTMPLFQKCRQNELEVWTLGKLRDTLLPKLLSGELRVGEAKQQVEATPLW